LEGETPMKFVLGLLLALAVTIAWQSKMLSREAWLPTSGEAVDCPVQPTSPVPRSV
jgi:hypothetical protein